MSAVSVRPMRPQDLDAVAALERFSPDPWNRGQLAEELRAPFARCLVLCEDGRVAAFCSAQLAADEATLNAVTVDPARRRRGLGRRLLTALEKELRAQGAAAVYLEVRSQNAAAIALYRSLGYTGTGRRPRFYRSPTDDALTMKKDLHV